MRGRRDPGAAKMEGEIGSRGDMDDGGGTVWRQERRKERKRAVDRAKRFDIGLDYCIDIKMLKKFNNLKIYLFIF